MTTATHEAGLEEEHEETYLGRELEVPNVRLLSRTVKKPLRVKGRNKTIPIVKEMLSFHPQIVKVG